MKRIKVAILIPDEYFGKADEKYEISRIEFAFGELEAERLRKINNRKARLSSLGGLVALSELVGDKSSTICRNAHGKPYFEDDRCGCFNISHSDKLSVAAIGDTALGIDVEKINPEKRVKKIAERFFTPKELLEFENNNYSCESFFKLWTRKEAYVKYLGESLASIASSNPENLTTESFVVENGVERYALSICSNSKFETEIEIFSESVRINKEFM